MRTLAAIQESARQFCRDAVDFIYARLCVRCNASLADFRDVRGECPAEPHIGGRLCPDCHELLSCTISHVCLRCGAPVGPYLDTANGCRHCRRDRFPFDRVFALGTYDGALQECCTRIKRPGTDPLTAALTELLFDAHRDEWNKSGIDLVVPVPHHWTDRVTRRHLPPVTMGRVLERRLMAPQALHILSKSRRTLAQSSLSPARRRANLREAFRIAGGARLDGLTILLVDDILTTGTTASRAARVLKSAGASRVLVAVLARGVGRPAHN